MKYTNEMGEFLGGKIALHSLIGVLVLVVLWSSFGTVRAGYRGVLTQFGAVAGVKNEGLFVKLPFIQGVVKMNVQTQKEQVDAASASKDLQTVHTTIALNFSIKPESVGEIYKTVGLEFKVKIIDPAIQESVKAVTAQFTAEELITKRESVREDIKNLLAEKISQRGMSVEDMNIVNFDFSDSFNSAIEAKVTAEQNALAAKNKLEQVKFEAQQRIAEAEGKARAISIEAQALLQNSNVLELRAIEKWNGVLPQVTGGATPFINVSK